MDLNALLQAAMQDPRARDFIGKLAGGQPPQPQADPQAMMMQAVQTAGRAPMQATGGVRQAVDEQLRAFNPAQAAPLPMSPQGMAPPPGTPPQGMAPGMPPQAPPAPAAPPTGGGIDLMSMLMGRR